MSPHLHYLALLLNVMETAFKSRYLFDAEAMDNTDKKLGNIANGLVAPPTVAVTNIKECGNEIPIEMVGCTPPYLQI